MAILSDYEEEDQRKASSSSSSAVKKPFGVALDPSDPLGFLEKVFEFVARESDLFKSDSLVRDVNAVVRMVKDKVEVEERKRKEAEKKKLAERKQKEAEKVVEREVAPPPPVKEDKDEVVKPEEEAKGPRGEIFEEEKVEEEEVEVEEEEVEVEVEKVEVEEEVEVEEVKEESLEKVHKWLFKEEEDMTWETYRYCCNWNTIERSILMKTIHNFAKANRPKDYWKVRTWMNLSDTYNEMAVRTNQIKRSYHEIIGGGKYLQSLFTIERQRHFHENTPLDQILLDIFEPCNECRNRIPVFPKSLLYNGSNPSTSFGSRTDSSSHSKKQWTPDELELLKSTISDFSSASVPKPYWDVQLWTDLSETYNVQARFKNLNTVSYLEFISGGMQLQSIFCEERLSNALHGFGSCGRDFVLMKIFEPCLECRKRIPVFPNGLPNNGSTSSASSSARSVQSHFTSYEDESYSATLNNMLIVVREMFEKGLLTSAQLLLVTLKLHDFAQTETWKVCLLNNIFTLEMKREVLIQSISPEA